MLWNAYPWSEQQTDDAEQQQNNPRTVIGNGAHSTLPPKAYLDVDAAWKHLSEQGFRPERPQDAPWGERYFHLRDPEGHELSFARPLA